MKTIIFICHGNVCRSTMAEFLMKDMLKKEGLEREFSVFSRGTSTEELGNPVHPGTRRILNNLGISCDGKYARQITKEECQKADMLIIMDERNRRNLAPFLQSGQEEKVFTLLGFAGLDRDISDPWYSHDFESTYRDVLLGCTALLKELKKRVS